MSEVEKNPIEEHLTERSTWLRLLFMLLFGFIFWLASMALSIVVVIQFFHVLFTGERNEILLRASRQLGMYFGELIGFLTYDSETRPFPFSEWPSEPEADAGLRTKPPTKKTAKKKATKKVTKKKTTSS